MDIDPPILTAYELLGDVKLTLHAELDHKTFTFGQLVDLRVGSVLNLARPTGENVDIFAGDIRIASGEILIIDSVLAIRIADLRGLPTDRTKAK